MKRIRELMEEIDNLRRLYLENATQEIVEVWALVNHEMNLTLLEQPMTGRYHN